MKRLKDIINESGLSRIWRHVQNHQAGAVTSYRGDRSKDENKKNNRELKAILRKKGYGVTSVDGSYIEDFGGDKPREVSEPSFFVVDLEDKGTLEKDLIKLGQRYDQDSVLVVPQGGKDASLVGTSKREDAFPSYGKSFKVGSGKYGKVAGEFLSRIRGREFTFEGFELPQTYNERWVDSILYKQSGE